MFRYFYLYIIIYATSLKYGNELRIIRDPRSHPAKISIWYRKLRPHLWYLCSTDLQREKAVAWEGTHSAQITIIRIFFFLILGQISPLMFIVLVNPASTSFLTECSFVSPHNQVPLMHKFQLTKCGMYTLALGMTGIVAKCTRTPHILVCLDITLLLIGLSLS